MRTAYSKPLIEVMHIHMDCQLMDTSIQATTKRNHKQGPAKKAAKVPNRAFFFSSDEKQHIEYFLELRQKDNKTLQNSKTVNGIRTIPIHDKLLSLISNRMYKRKLSTYLLH